MTKPSHIWLTLSVCGLLIVGAMGWLTKHVLDLESERARAVEESDLQNRVRLALAAMDTAASGLLVIENQRPPHHFRAFYNPGDVFDASFNNYEQSQVLRPSPLANDLPEFVKLHFEILPDGTVTSPQVPQVDDGIWGKILNPSQKVLKLGNANFQDLNEILVAPAAPAPSNLPANVSNGSVLRDVVNEAAPDLEEQASKDREVGGKGDWVAQQVIESTAQERIQSSSYQAEFSKVERGNRKRVFEDTLKKAAEESSNIGLNSFEYQRRSLGRADDSGARDQAGDAPEEPPVAPASGAVRPAALAQAQMPPQPEPERQMDVGQTPEGVMQVADASVSPFRVLWLAGELFAVRRVELAGEERFQGVWFEAKALERYLLEAVSHYLPSASLEPFGAVASLTEGVGEVALDDLQDDPLALVTMPWRLRPGEIAKTSSLFQFTQVHLALGVGWVAVLFALLAAAVLVQGVLRLSERRASFVSSVTHELRTPLTTFQLYSDLLAEGMVTDPDKKQSYLETLRAEAGRLNHLIENVLAYSRIERGAARTRKESLELSALVERLRPRLEERVKGGGMGLKLDVEESCADRVVETDPGAVEQILFNLVDNACKYGKGAGDEGEVHVKVSCRGKRVRLEVQDNGDGIPRGDRRRLFRPFQKAARDEGDTKPGVGLGLSLCRRLARALGGDLRLASARKPGACFVLELPGA